MDERTFSIRWDRQRIVFRLTLILEVRYAFNTVSMKLGDDIFNFVDGALTQLSSPAPDQ
jgi:hypothetical protein